MQASLVKAKENEDARKKEAEQTNWSTLGIAKFAEILRMNNDNIAEFSYQVISNLVKYIGAQIGSSCLMMITLKICISNWQHRMLMTGGSYIEKELR